MRSGEEGGVEEDNGNDITGGLRGAEFDQFGASEVDGVLMPFNTCDPHLSTLHQHVKDVAHYRACTYQTRVHTQINPARISINQT